VISRAEEGFVGCLVEFAASADEAFGAFEQTFVPLFTGGADSYAWHGKVPIFGGQNSISVTKKQVYTIEVSGHRARGGGSSFRRRGR
jgi:hypothetical protein